MRTLSLWEEEQDDDEVHSVQANEDDVVLPTDTVDSAVGDLREEDIESPVRALENQTSIYSAYFTLHSESGIFTVATVEFKCMRNLCRTRWTR